MGDGDIIKVRGARQHNLKGVDLDLPKHKISVITGPSGCGKSSLVFHTLYAEAQRRYIECLGISARMKLNELPKPEFDLIEGLTPAVALEQQRPSERSSETVATLTEIYSYLQVLYTHLGVPHDPETGERLEKLTAEDVVNKVLSYPERTKLILLAPISAMQIEDLDGLKEDLRRQGFVRVRIDGTLFDLDEQWPMAKEQFEVVIDRLVVKEGFESRFADSLELALKVSKAEIRVLTQEKGENAWSTVSFSTSYRNPKTGFELHELSAKCFSPNSQLGACPTCNGTGHFEDSPCPTCEGKRVNPIYQAVTLFNSTESSGLSICDLTALTVEQLTKWFSTFLENNPLSKIESELTEQIQKRLTFLQKIGLDYIQLNRFTKTLSGGELQRLRIANQLGAGLTGITYFLDEPSIGLSSTETTKLIDVLTELRDAGNTIILVEHDPDLIQASDYLFELGEGAGEHGGALLTSGTTQSVLQNKKSLTAQWLTQKTASLSLSRNHPSEKEFTEFLSLKGANSQNLQNVSVELPLNALVGITGVSGSGKSSLLFQTLAPFLKEKLNKARPSDIEVDEITGWEQLSRIAVVDQSPIGKSPRSSAATYSGAFDPIRKLFAQLPLSKQRGYQASRFSFNVKGGRCERCLGAGVIKFDLFFMSDRFQECPSCHGKRYNRETLDILFKGYSIADILNASIEENLSIFRNVPSLNRLFTQLCAVGLGYLKLGQPAETLSGGEAQRVKIATELAKLKTANGEHNLYLLDEPTTGLFFSDIEVLLSALRSLVDAGHSVITIEHNEQFLQQADWLIEMGPGAGKNGGKVLKSESL